jgi:hypothetical protein
MPRTSRQRPAFLRTWWEKVVLLVVLIAAALIVLQWWTGRQSSGPARPGMAPASVVHEEAAASGKIELTIRYRVDGKTYDVTKPVDAAAFREQGKVAWACYAPGDPADASIRLPEDPLCAQQ